VKNKIVLITGGSKGCGAGIAEVMVRAGAKVWITGREQMALYATAKRPGVKALQGDVTSPADWDRVFAAIQADAGRLDVLALCRTPAHLAIPDITVQPLVQQIESM